MKYTFRPLPELYWGVVTAASLVLLQALFTLDPEAITDWQTWAVALGGGTVRAASGAALDYLRRSMTQESEPATAGADYSPEFVDAVADALLRKRAEELAQRYPAGPLAEGRSS